MHAQRLLRILGELGPKFGSVSGFSLPPPTKLPCFAGVQATLASPVRQQDRDLDWRSSSGFASAFSDSLREKRQLLTSSDPAYGFSGYFKPVILQPHSITSSSWFEVALLVVALLLLLLVLAGAVLYFLHK